jgi:hypothetical protein
MRPSLPLLITLAAALVTSSADARDAVPRSEPVGVYCAAATRGGFIDPDVADSLRDLKDALRGKKKTLRLVTTPAEAALVITVEERAKEFAGRDVALGPLILAGVIVPKTKTVKTVYATLEAAGEEFMMAGVNDDFWQLAAEDLAGRIDRWIKVNRARLTAP